MGSLSTNASSGSRSSHGGGAASNEFDEQHVNCALEILRIAGMFKRNLRAFEYSVRDRLRMLSKEMVDTVLEKDTDSGGLGGTMIPDEIAPVQIRAMLAREACDPNPTFIDDGSGVKYPTSVVELRRLAGSANSNNESPTLFPRHRTLRLVWLVAASPLSLRCVLLYPSIIYVAYRHCPCGSRMVAVV